MQREMDRARDAHVEEATALRRELETLNRRLSVSGAQHDGNLQRAQADVRSCVVLCLICVYVDQW